MTLQDIFDQLAFGELSQVFMGEGGEAINGIPEAERPRLLAHVELGLSALYQRFTIKENSLTVVQEADKNTYLLTAPDLIKVTRVTDPKNKELTLNVVGDPDALRTPTYKTLVIPKPVAGEPLTVVYRAQHPAMDKITAAAYPAGQEIELPPVYLNALLLFIASRVHNPIGITAEFHDGNNYAAKYEHECMLLTLSNNELDPEGVLDRVTTKGFP